MYVKQYGINSDFIYGSEYFVFASVVLLSLCINTALKPGWVGLAVLAISYVIVLTRYPPELFGKFNLLDDVEPLLSYVRESVALDIINLFLLLTVLSLQTVGLIQQRGFGNGLFDPWRLVRGALA